MGGFFGWRRDEDSGEFSSDSVSMYNLPHRQINSIDEIVEIPMGNSFQMTREFHRAFGLPVNDSPIEPTVEERILRAKLLMEETLETITQGLGITLVLSDGPPVYPGEDIELADLAFVVSYPYDPIETLDGLADIKVIANGTAVQFGLPMEAADREVFESNMSKLGEDGKPVVNYCCTCGSATGNGCTTKEVCQPGVDPTQPIGKVLKGPNYRKPNIEGLLR